jgi:mannose-6-phosphate isomerase
MVKVQESRKTESLAVFSAIHDNNVFATETRPWGSFTTLEEGLGYKIKRIEVNPGHRLSLQMHHHRSEHWIVVSGTAKVTCGDCEEILGANQSTYVPQCTAHRLENPGVIKLVLIEVQNGEYLGEDDIIRFQDDYARHQS